MVKSEPVNMPYLIDPIWAHMTEKVVHAREDFKIYLLNIYEIKVANEHKNYIFYDSKKPRFSLLMADLLFPS